MDNQQYAYGDDSKLLGQAISVLAVENKILEIGVGGGGNLNLLSKFKSVVTTDIVRPNDISEFKGSAVSLVLADRATCFRNAVFDVVLFNPPYVPSDKILDKAVDGGPTGMEVPLQFLESALEVTKPEGRILMLLSSDDSLELFEAFCRERKLEAKKVAEKRMFFEVIFVYLIERSRANIKIE